ncbi:MAG: hypothetical protein ABSD89_01845 [Halobacteriota archaeon]|jgi:hypothetical protein
MKKHEPRISELEKRHGGDGSDLHENVVQTSDSPHIERPHDLRKIIEDAVSFVHNDPKSTGVVKGRALAYIAGIAARILPLFELEELQEEVWEKRRKEQAEWFDLVSSSAKASEAVDTLIEIMFQKSVTTGKPLTITDELEGWKVELDARQR